MKKLLLALVFSLLTFTPCFAQQGVHSRRFTIAGPDSAINLTNTSIAWHKLTWTVSGTASACTVALDTSTNGTTWTAGGAITGQTCTSNGASSAVNVVANFVRINMTALTVTAGSSVTVTWDGFTSDPSGGGGGGTPGGSPTQLQYNNTTFDGVKGSAVDAASGQITLTPIADANVPITINEHSATQSRPLVIYNLGSTDTACNSTSTFFVTVPAICVLEGAGSQSGMYISADGSIADSAALHFHDTQATTLDINNAIISWNIASGLGISTAFGNGNDTATLLIGNNNGDPNAHDGSITLGCGSVDPIVFFPHPALVGGGNGATINCTTGEIAAGDVINAANGFFSITDAPATHKISMKNPGTMSADYDWDYPIIAGAIGQVLTSQGGAGTPMIWTNPGTTATNCSSSASPAVCGAAAAGSVAIPTGTTSSTLQVNTTAVTANSQIVFYPDDTLGTKLGSITCNNTLATLAGGSFISARTPGVSFTITFNGSILTNKVCGSYFIIN